MDSRKDWELAITLATLPDRLRGGLDRKDPASVEQEKDANEARVAPLRRLVDAGALGDPKKPLALVGRQLLEKNSLLSAAIGRDDWHAARVLLEAGAPATDLDAFQDLAWRGNAAYVELLRAFGADFHATNADGDCVLHFAAREDCKDVFRAARKAAPKTLLAKNRAGQSPLESWLSGGGSQFSTALAQCVEDSVLDPNHPLQKIPAYVFLLEAQTAEWASEQEQKAARDLLDRLGRAGSLDFFPCGEHVATLAPRELAGMRLSLQIIARGTLGRELEALAAKHERVALAKVADDRSGAAEAAVGRTDFGARRI
jgi:hypothetical protein